MMSVQQQHGYGHQEQVLYQCHHDHPQSLKSNRDHIHHLCNQYQNQLVRVETLDGEAFEGTLLQCNRGILYIKLSGHGGHGGQRGFSPYYNNVILPLVLYELLVITLLLL